MSRPENIRLDSWKDIAGYLHVDVRTARRWAQDRGLPVRRIPGEGRRAVYAYSAEIDEWLRSGDRPPPNSFEPRQAQDDIAREAQPHATRASQDAISNPGFGPDNSSWTRRNPTLTFGTVGFVALILLVFLVARLLPGFVTHSSQVTRIDNVSPIYAETIQTLVIRGHGFGPRPGTIHMESGGGVDTLAGSNQTSLVIANLGQGPHHWTAGRASEVNACEISVRLESWSDSQIVLSGFSGPIGWGCGEKYQIAAGDPIEIGVFGPLNQCGPGGIPNCPAEVQDGHIGVIQTQVLPSTTTERRCR